MAIVIYWFKIRIISFKNLSYLIIVQSLHIKILSRHHLFLFGSRISWSSLLSYGHSWLIPYVPPREKCNNTVTGNAWLLALSPYRPSIYSSHLSFIWLWLPHHSYFAPSIMTSVATGCHFLYQQLLPRSLNHGHWCKPYSEYSEKCEGTIFHFLVIQNLPFRSLCRSGKQHIF